VNDSLLQMSWILYRQRTRIISYSETVQHFTLRDLIKSAIMSRCESCWVLTIIKQFLADL